MTDHRTRLPHRHDPRLPAHRASPRTQARRRGASGPARIDAAELEARAAELRARDARAPRRRSASAAPTRRSPSRSRTTTRCSTPRSPSAPCPRASPTCATPTARIDLAGYFTVARGEGDDAPLEMTKWFDSNYHYLVPEIGPETAFALRERPHRRASSPRRRRPGSSPARSSSARSRFLLLAKATDDAPDGFAPARAASTTSLPVYAELLAALAAAGAEWVQLDEPALVSESIDDAARARARAIGARATTRSARPSDRPAIFVAAPLRQRSTTRCRALAAAPVEAIGARPRARLGARRARSRDRGVARRRRPSSPASSTATTSGAATSPRAFEQARRAALALGADVAVSTSTSLLHVPHDVDDETDARRAPARAGSPSPTRRSRQVADARPAASPRGATRSRPSSTRHPPRSPTAPAAPGVRDGAVRDRAAALADGDFDRAARTTSALAAQEALDLPVLPTTTIGSFPQTGEIRRARARH